MSRSGVRRVSRTIVRSRSDRRSRRGRWTGKVMPGPRSVVVRRVVVVAEEEGVGALLALEHPAVAGDPALLARPLEADLALVEPEVLVVAAARHARHSRDGHGGEYNR